MKPLRLLSVLWFLLLCLHAQSQRNLFKANIDALPGTINQKLNMDARSIQVYSQYKNNPYVSRVSLVEIDPKALKEHTLVINGEKNILARQSALEKRGDDNFSWFGALEDETGVFFTVMGNSVMAKFYSGVIPCTLLPLKGLTHMIVEYKTEISEANCLNRSQKKEAVNGKPPIVGDPEPQGLVSPLPNDNTCTVRLLIAVTATAETELGLNLDQVAQMLADETNLAYQQSQINFRVEIARVMRTGYNEVNTFESNGQSTDVVNFRNGTAPLNAVQTMRNVYQSDIQILIRRGNFINGGNQFFGEAFEVPVLFSNPDPDNAFCWVVTDFIIGGRFTFAHEMGHLQGGRHDNHTASPAYARGFILNGVAGSIRTIMSTAAVVGCGTINNGCRVQFFSNPNVVFNGNAMGAADRDNARRLNETANAVRSHRRTSENLTVTNETFDSEILANHLANSTITTSGMVVGLSGSRVTMRATDQITLTPGFQINSGGLFRAVVINQPCGNLPPIANRIVTVMDQKAGKTESATMDSYIGGHSVKVYPNPVSQQLAFELQLNQTSDVSLYITNAAGNFHSSVLDHAIYNKGLNRVQMNTSTLNEGIYFYQLIIDGNRTTGKIIVLHK